MIRKKESIEKLNQYWDQNNVQQIIDGNGNFNYLKIMSERSDTDLLLKGVYKNGLKDGFWTVFIKITLRKSIITVNSF
jgi:hypothetical protein